MRTYKPSVLIQDPDERLIAVVEARSKPDMSEEDATETRSGMLEYGISAHIPYLMVLSQEVGFLWKGNSSVDEKRPPDYEFPTNSVFERFSSTDEPGKRLIYVALPDPIMHWLLHLSYEPEDMGGGEPEKTLARAGFTDAIHNALVFTGDTL